jgi:hypothetical protein
MENVMILWGTEHELRAKNLAAVVKEKSGELGGMVASPATIPASSDATITIWGHGGPDTLADLSAQELANFIKAWKQKNAALTTVELVTCDARHSPADKDNRDTFTDKLMPYLISSADKVLVNVKALPRGGSSATTSILYAGEVAGSNGYYFIAADNDAALAAGVAVFKAALAAVPAGTAVGATYQALLPIAKAANDKAAMKKPLSYVASGGNFAALRGLLANVTVYIVDGKRLAVPKKLG